jgi:hypothetical protein
MLNRHFESDGLRFSQSGPREWLLRVPRTLDLSAPAPLDAHGLPAMLSSPQGADAAWARKLSNEVQMLLHQSPVNSRREERRQWTVNSLWLWGGGMRPSDGGENNTRASNIIPANRDVMIFSDAKYVRGIAQAAGAQAQPLPAAWPAVFESPAAKALIDLTELSGRADGMALLEANWLQPAAQARKARKLTFFCTLLIDGHSFRTKLYGGDLFHFFCRKSLAHYVGNIQNQRHT